MNPLPLVPEDDLPEHTRYQDTGCRHSPHCLECPFKPCLEEVPGGYRAYVRQHRNAEIINLAASGMLYREIAERYGMTARHVARVVAINRHNTLCRVPV